MVDFEAPASVSGAALVPTDKGVAKAGQPSALEDVESLKKALPKSRKESVGSEDEFVDCH